MRNGRWETLAGPAAKRTESGTSGRLATAGLLALAVLLPGVAFGQDGSADTKNLETLPARYYRLMKTGIEALENRLAGRTEETAGPGERRWRGPGASEMLAAAVLYKKQHPDNPGFGDPKMLELGKLTGDIVAKGSASGDFDRIPDNHRELYLWTEAYRLLKNDVEPEREAAWRKELLLRQTELAGKLAARADFPVYSGFVGTSVNHFALWASTVYVGGIALKVKAWQDLGARVLRRLVTEEQSPDGCWGEHGHLLPTTGYNYLTFSAAAVYYEHSLDPDALAALRRGTNFHIPFTYPNGDPVETVNGRNRYWAPSSWGTFGFSHFPDGRRYAEWLTAIMVGDESRGRGGNLGRFAQNALYYHEGPTEPIFQDRENAAHRMSMVPAGIRKTGRWTVCLSGLISPPVEGSFQLHRQGNLSVFREGTGLIITGANSKHQPELATFHEKYEGYEAHMPLDSRLRMGKDGDRLALRYGTFWTDLQVPEPTDEEVRLRFHILPATWNRSTEATLNLQLCFRPGETVETEAGARFVVSEEKFDLTPDKVGGWIRHGEWTIMVPGGAALTWPVYPYNPYRAVPETGINRAVARLSVPVRAWRMSEDLMQGEPYGADAYDLEFTVRVTGQAR